MHRISRAIALSCLLGAAFGAASWGQKASPEGTIDNFRWTGPLAPAAEVSVLNPYGDVRVRAAEGGEVEVSAMIQRWASQPATAEVRLVRRRGRLTIEVVYPAASAQDLRRVDLAVFVPAGAPLAVRTRNGLIQARGLESDVRLESAGGDVVLATTGAARVRSDRGDISASLGRDGTRASRLATRAGDITLSLPTDADARVKIRAAGKIAVRGPARVERRTARKTIVSLGQGTHLLSLDTRRGGVTLLSLTSQSMTDED